MSFALDVNAVGPASTTHPVETPRSDDVVLTGDRPTGVLHLGHYAGSLSTRLALQGRCTQTLLLADLQALTDASGRASHVAAHVEEVALDYLAVGIDPALTAIAVQSRLPALAELTMLYLNLVTVARLRTEPDREGRGAAPRIHSRSSCRLSLLPSEPGRRHHCVQGDTGPGW